MEIVPQVHRVPGTRGANVYLIEDATLTVVDTGLRGNAGAIINYVARLGRRPEDLRAIVLTHHHLDHAGSAAELQARTGAEVLVHAADIDAFQQNGEWTQPRYEGMRGLLGQLTAILPWKDSRSEGTLRTTPLRDGRMLAALGGLVVVHTPDHTPGSICLYSPARRLIFVGDIVLNNRNRLSRPLPSRGSVQAVYEASLWRLASLEFEVCLFGHGPPVLEGGSRLVREVAERAPSRFLLGRIARNLGTLISFGRRLSRRS